MRVAVYARVSDDAQKEKQTIESQLAEVRQFAKEQDWPLDEQHIYADDGYSGFYFELPALDRLRDAARDGLIDLLLVHDPDRFARRYAYQVLLLEEFQRWGVEVRFVKQPPPGQPRSAAIGPNPRGHRRIRKGSHHGKDAARTIVLGPARSSRQLPCSLRLPLPATT